jgi:hypothetical protein
MRHTWCALVGVTLVACCSQDLAAAEAGSKWWPFGRRDEASVAQPPTVATPSTTPPLAPQSNRFAAPLGTATPAPANPQFEQPSATAETSPKENWMFSTKKGKVGWPQLNKPQLPPALSARKPAEDATRNSWVEQEPITPKPSPLQPLADSARKIGKSTKAAWNKTVDAVTPGELTPRPSPGARVAKRNTEPPFYRKWFSPKEAPRGSETVPEFMAQQRLDP